MQPTPDVPLTALDGLERAALHLLLRLLAVLAVYVLLRILRWPLLFTARVLGAALGRLDGYALTLTAAGVPHGAR